MSADPWSTTRREFERLREMEPEARERTLRARSAETARELRQLLALDAAEDSLLDTDAPSLDAAWLRRSLRRDVRIGDEIGGYRIVERLGEGGSATVYRADGERSVAIKVLKPESCSPGLSKRFEQECETLAGLDHPGLIRVLSSGRLEDGRPYLVTEHVAGVPIDAHCDGQRLDLDSRLSLFADVCRAVHHAHAHLVVHRDLKPSNILVDAHGQPKVLDFGVAKLLDPARDPAWTELYGRGPLTPAYASPEQIRGETITTASDVYSLGVLLCELALGAGPYAEPRADRDALERAVASGRRRNAHDIASAAGRAPPPRDLEAILERALALHPRDRYASAEHLAQDVGCFVERRPLLSRSEPWTRRVARFVRRRPWTAAASVGLCLVVLGSWIGTQRSLQRVAASESVAWRAHANAVRSTNLLADLLERIGASAIAGDELARLVTETEQHLPELAQHPETEARLRMALARLERARGRLESAETHVLRALDLSRVTRGMSWNDTERCLEQASELRALRNDPSCVDLARERVALLRERGADTASAQAALDALIARFANDAPR